MKIFSEKKHNAETGISSFEWPKIANGKEAKDGYIVGTFLMCSDGAVDDWCVDTAPLMERFKREKIAVKTGDGEYLDTFLEMCEEAGLKWNSGIKATEFRPRFYRAKTCIAYKMEHYDFYTEEGLGNASNEFYEVNGYKVIDFIDFINLEVDDKAQQPSVPRYKITITCEGTTTTAAFEIDGKTVKTATAKCNPIDKFNFHTGAELAFDRLFEKQPKALDLHNLKVGDKVRVRKDLKANDEMSDGTLFTYDMARFCGKVVTISEKEFGKYHIAEDKLRWYYTEEMFENI